MTRKIWTILGCIIIGLAIILASCGGPVKTCCKYCDPNKSIPCGDSCICKDYECHKGENTGCACWR